MGRNRPTRPASGSVAAKLIVVDSIDDDAVAFYEHNGFAPTGVEQRLVMKMSTAAKHVAHAGT